MTNAKPQKHHSEKQMHNSNVTSLTCEIENISHSFFTWGAFESNISYVRCGATCTVDPSLDLEPKNVVTSSKIEDVLPKQKLSMSQLPVLPKQKLSMSQLPAEGVDAAGGSSVVTAGAGGAWVAS